MRGKYLFFCSRMLLGGSLTFLMACPAEQLGVEIPRGGLSSLSIEDVTRDVMMVRRSGNRIRDTQRRLQDMRTLPAFGRSYHRVVADGEMLCGRRDGRMGEHSQEAIVVLAFDSRDDDLGGGSQIAGLISLAKIFDQHEPPKRSLVFCVTDREGGRERYFASPPVPLENTVALFTLGVLSGASETEINRTEESMPTGGALIHLHMDEEPSASNQLDFHTILSSVRALHDEITGLQE